MKKITGIIVLSILFLQCGIDNNKFLIAKNKLGNIDKKTTVAELDVIFEKDSVVKLPKDSDIFNRYMVYTTAGKKIMLIHLNVKRDTIQGIDNIKIWSDTYKTEKEVSTASTFKDILNNYSISKIEPFFKTVALTLNEINVTIALDKEDLNIQEFDMKKIRKDQIPDMAKIKYITLWFE